MGQRTGLGSDGNRGVAASAGKRASAEQAGGTHAPLLDQGIRPVITASRHRP
jgi:hypothetical protein